MVRFLAIAVGGLLLIGPQSAKVDTQPPVALVVELSAQQDVQRLLDELETSDAQITFFLGEEAATKEQIEKIAAAGHEIALTIHSREQSGGLLSRRNMAAQISNNRLTLPPGIKPHWLRLEEGLTDGARQVAKAKNLAILETNHGALHQGQVIDLEQASVDQVLLTVKKLMEQGYRLVTVTELARLNRVQVHPGKVYEDFAVNTPKDEKHTPRRVENRQLFVDSPPD